MRIVAVTNIKGGVGKTTTAVNLAWLAAAAGTPTVLWDLDAQGGSTFILRCEPLEHVGVRKLLSGKRDLNELVLQSAWERLDVIPADFSYRKFDVALSERKKPTERLLKMSSALAQDYGTLVLDCPPGISLLTENVLHAADAVVVPLLPTPLSIRMLDELTTFVKAREWTDVKVLPFFSMVDRRKSLHAEVIAAARERHPDLLATEVPYSSDIERMAVRRAPLCAYAPRSAPGLVYAALWDELGKRMGDAA